MNNDLLMLIAYAAFLYAMYRLYEEYLKVMAEPRPSIILATAAAEPEPAKGTDA